MIVSVGALKKILQQFAMYCTNVANDELWVQCERCARWVHGRCTGKNEDNWTENEFKCELCTNYKES